MLAAPSHCQRFGLPEKRAWRTALTGRHVAAIVSALVFGSAGEQRALGTRPARQLETRKEDLMGRTATLGTALLLAFTLITPADVLAQTKDDTLVYAAPERRPDLGSPQLRAPRERHPRLQRLRPPGRARPQDRQGGPEPRGVVEERGRHDLGGQAPEGCEVPRRHAVRRQGRQGHLRPRAEPREQAHRPRQPRQDQERRGGGRRDGAVQDGRPLPGLRRAAHRPGDAVREGDQGEGPRVAAGQPRSAPAPTSSRSGPRSRSTS